MKKQGKSEVKKNKQTTNYLILFLNSKKKNSSQQQQTILTVDKKDFISTRETKASEEKSVKSL